MKGLTRRGVLGAGAGLGLAACLGPTWPAKAQSSRLHRVKVGAAEVTVISDGEMELPVAFFLPGRSEAEIEKAFGAGSVKQPIKAQVNIALVRIGDSLLLVDAGGGSDFMPGLGKLADRLGEAGVKPEQITHVVFTHAHADHLWGTIDPLTDDSMFESAKHVMVAAERDYWVRPGIESSMPESFRGMAMGTQRRLKAIAGRLVADRAGSEILPGVTLIDTGGHTPGHVSVRIESGGQQLMIGGDALSSAQVSFAYPDWRWGPDMDPDRAVSARRKLLDMLATDKTLLLGYHLPWPGLGRVERGGTAFRYVPA